MFVLPYTMRTYLLLYTDSRIWMVDVPGNEYSVFNCDTSSFRLAPTGQLFYSVIYAYDPNEAIAEGKRIFMNHVKNTIF